MLRRSISLIVLTLSLGITVLSVRAAGGSSGGAGMVTGTVKDQSGAVIPGAIVTIRNPVTGFERTTATDTAGGFSFTNIPFNPYHLTVRAFLG